MDNKYFNALKLITCFLVLTAIGLYLYAEYYIPTTDYYKWNEECNKKFGSGNWTYQQVQFKKEVTTSNLIYTDNNNNVWFCMSNKKTWSLI